LYFRSKNHFSDEIIWNSLKASTAVYEDDDRKKKEIFDESSSVLSFSSSKSKEEGIILLRVYLFFENILIYLF
jgi:hypothetical protein